MKKFRKFSENPIVIILVLLNFMLVSCNRDSNFETRKIYTGEELMKGLFFFQNDISDNISFIRDFKQQIYHQENKESVNQELNDLSNNAINYINNYNPRFFNEFQKAMYSKNFYLMQTKLDECVLLIGNSMAMSEKYSKAFKFAQEVQKSPEFMKFIEDTDLTSTEGQQKLNNFLKENPEYKFDEDGQQIGVPIFVGPAAIAYVFVGAVSIAIAAYSVITKAAYWDPTKKDSGENKLNREVLVKELNEYLTP